MQRIYKNDIFIKVIDLRSILLSMLIVAALFANIKVAAIAGMLDILPGWQIDAIPAALSHQIYGHPANYTQLDEIQQTFNAHLKSTKIDDIDQAIHEAMSLPKSLKSTYSLLGSDDKGVVDFVEVSFSIFGFSAKSLYKTYFTLIIISIICFLMVYWRIYPLLLVILAILLAHAALIIPTALNPQLTSVLALRFMPVLGLIGTFHLILATFSQRTSWLNILTGFIQACIILLSVHVRFSAFWEITAVPMALTLLLVWTCFHTWPRWRHVISMTWPTIILLSGFLFMQSIEHERMAKEYLQGKQITGHVFWHSLFSGLALEPILSNTLHIKLDDVSVITATGQYLITHGRQKEWIRLGGTSKEFSSIHWATYDLAVRDMFIDTCLSHSIRCFKAILWDKPYILAWNLAWLVGITNSLPLTQKLDNTVLNQLSMVKKQLQEKFNKQTKLFFQISVFLILTAIIICLIRKVTYEKSHVISVSTLWAASLLPSLLAYPIPHAIAEPAICTVTFSIFLILVVLISLTKNLGGKIA